MAILTSPLKFDILFIMNNYKKISLVTVVYNNAEFLEQTFLSVFNQNYPNLEYIVIDGGSTDGSVDIIKKYQDKIAYWVSEKDNGMYDALNKGFSHATGEILGWINSDDMLFEHTLFELSKIFTDMPQIEWLTGLHTTINEENILIETIQSPRFLTYSFRSSDFRYIQQESTFWRRDLLNKLNGNPFDLRYKYAGDFHLWFKFFLLTDLYFVDVPLGKFRIRKNQLSQTNYDSYIKEIETIIEEYIPDIKEKKEIKKYKFIRNLLKFLYKFKFIDTDRIRNFIYKDKIREVNIKYDTQRNIFVSKKEFYK